MGLADVNITLTDGGLGKQAAGRDYVSALFSAQPLADDGNPFPSGIRRYRSLAQAEAEGFDTIYASEQNNMLHYHISEYFRLKPNGELWVWINETDTAMTPAEIATALLQMQREANGDIRQFALHAAATPATFAALLAGLQPAFSIMEGEKNPAVCLIEVKNIWNGTAFAAMPDRLDAYKYFTPIVSYDGSDGGLGGYYDRNASTSGVAGGDIGTALGTLSAATVSTNIGHVGSFQLSDGVRFVRPGFTGAKNLSEVSRATLDDLDDAGLVFAVSRPNVPGAYWNFDHTYATETSDYNRLALVRVAQKALREVYAALVKDVNAKVSTERGTGKLSPGYIAHLKATATIALKAMDDSGDIEDEGYGMLIDPDQNVQGTNRIDMAIKIIPYGTSKEINVMLGFTRNISNA